jgi:hypothetical protein
LKNFKVPCELEKPKELSWSQIHGERILTLDEKTVSDYNDIETREG